MPVNKPIQRFFRMKPVGSDDYKRDYSTFNGLKHIGSSYFKIAKGRVVKVSRVRN